MMKKTCQNSWKRVCSLTLCAALVLGSVHPLTAEVYIGEEDMQENINAFDDIILAEDAEDEGGSLIEGLPEDEEMTPDEDLLPGEEELTDEEGFIEEEVIPMAGSGQAASGGEEGGGIIIEEPGEENEEPTVFVEDEIYAVGTVAGSSYIGSWHREELLVKVERSTGIITAVEQKDDISSIWLPSKLRR